MSYYPVSLVKVRDKAARKSGEMLYLPLGEHPAGYTSASPRAKKFTNSFGESVPRLDGEIPAAMEFRKDERYLLVSYSRSRYTHSLGTEGNTNHKYQDILIPELAGWLIKHYSKPGDIILAPYAGSCIINLEALLNKRHSLGIESDPYARALARAKITPLNENEVNRSLEVLLRNVTNYTPELVAPEDIPLFPFRDKWYQKEIILELSYIRNEINQLWVSKELKDFYKICFASILRAVSNYEVNSKGNWVRKRTKKVYPTMALTMFAESLLMNTLRIMNFSNICPKHIITEFPDESGMNRISYPDGYFNLAIASIPGADTSYFSGAYPPEYYWLGLTVPMKFHDDGSGKHEYGRYRIKAKRAELKLDKIFGTDITAAYLTYKYLEDLRANMEEVYRTLEDGGKYVIAAGNLNFRGQSYESGKCITGIAKQVGFKIHNTFISENIRDFMKTPEKDRINPDRIIVLEK